MTWPLRALRENFLLKTLALALSVMIWAYVGISEKPPTTSREFMAEVVAINTPPPDLIVRVRPEPVPVEVTGPKPEVDSIPANGIRAVVDLSTARAGTNQLRIVGYRGPREGMSLSFRERRMYAYVDVEPKLRKRMRIELGFVDRPPFGQQFAPPRITPSAVDVVGSKARLDRVARVVAYVSTQAGSVREEIEVHALDKSGVLVEDVEVVPRAALVELTLVDAPATRTLVVSPSLRGRPQAPYVVSDVLVDPSQVTVIGKSEDLVPLTNVPTADVPVDGIRADLVRDVPLRLPPGVRVRDDRETVRVIVRVMDVSRPQN